MSAATLDRIGVYARLRNFVEMAGGGSRFAETRGLTPSQVCDALSGKSLGPAILEAIGVEKRVTTTYVVKGNNAG